MRRMTRMTRKAKTKKKMKTNLIMINKMRILLVTPPTNESVLFFFLMFKRTLRLP